MTLVYEDVHPLYLITILRGIPGSGKSTWTKMAQAENLQHGIRTVVCSADQFFVGPNGKYEFNASKLHDAHRACLRNFTEAVVMRDLFTLSRHKGLHIIVDNTNIRLWEMETFIKIAEAFSDFFKLEIVHVNCDVATAAGRNVHGVPATKVEDMAKKLEMLPAKWAHYGKLATELG